MTPIDRSPTRLSRTVSGAFAVVALLAGCRYSWTALGVGTAGLAVLLAGIGAGSRSRTTLGCALLFVGTVIAGVRGGPVGAILVSTVATVLAWDAGTTAIDLGDQLGREAPTARLELVHIAGSAGVGLLTAGSGYLVYANAAGGYPLSALLALIVAAVLLVPRAVGARDD